MDLACYNVKYCTWCKNVIVLTNSDARLPRPWADELPDASITDRIFGDATGLQPCRLTSIDMEGFFFIVCFVDLFAVQGLRCRLDVLPHRMQQHAARPTHCVAWRIAWSVKFSSHVAQVLI